jgi:hypothetical protein
MVFRDARGMPFEPAQVRVELSNAAAGIEGIGRTLARTGPGAYRYRGEELAFPGAWRVDVRARIDDFEYIDLRATVELR